MISNIQALYRLELHWKISLWYMIQVQVCYGSLFHNVSNATNQQSLTPVSHQHIKIYQNLDIYNMEVDIVRDTMDMT